jgi:TetR/AcrR family tetracycline transcriptional repressor
VATKTSPKKPAAPELNRAALVDRALLIADVESLEAVTIRRLALDFSVTPMALYWHFKNKDELLAAMGDAFYAELDLTALGDAELSWHERLRAVLELLVSALRRHPGSASLAMPRIMACRPGLELTERTLQLLRDAGFSAQASADIARTALQTALMLVFGMPGGESTVAEDEREAVLAVKRAAVAGLPPEEFPRLVESVDALTSCEDDDAYFGFGVQLFVAGVVAQHGQQQVTARV